MHRLARVLVLRRESAQAEALFRVSNGIFEQAGPDYRRELAIGLSRLGALFIEEGRYRDAEPLYQRAWEILSAIPDAVPLDTARLLNNLGTLEFYLGRYDKAEATFLRALEIKQELQLEDAGLAKDLNNLAEVYRVQARWSEAGSLYLRALEILREEGSPGEIATALANLALLEAARAHYASAEMRFREALALLQGLPEPDPLDVALQQTNLGEMLIDLARFQEAEDLLLAALEIRRELLGDANPLVASSQEGLARLRKAQARFDEAESLLRASLEIREAAFSDQHPEVALGLNNLADLLILRGEYTEAETRLRRAQAIYETAFGPDHPGVATCLDNLAVLARLQGRPGEAAALLERSLNLRRARQDEDGAATVLNNLGALYEDQGRLAEGLLAHRQALETLERIVGRRHPRYAIGLQNLASIYESQQRLPQAEALYREALESLEAVAGRNHPDVASILSNLGGVVLSQGRLLEAQTLFERLLAIREETLGPEHPDVASALDALATIAFVRNEDAETESFLRRSLELRRKALGREHPEVTESLNNLAFLLLLLGGRDAEAAQMVDEALRILEQVPAYPERRVSLYGTRARLRKKQGDLDGAIAALAQALAAAERLRPGVGGSEETKAVFLAQYETLFHDMVSWQLEAGRIDRAFEHTERRRARVLLDQIAAAHVDWRAGIPDEIRSPLLEREARAGARLAELQQRVRTLAGAVPADLAQALREAESAYAEIYEEIRNASLLWQESTGGEPVSLDQVQTEIVRPGELALLYDIGDEESYLFVIPPAGETPRVVRLEVPEDAARILDLKPGPLRADDLDRVLLGKPGDGELAGGLLEDLSISGRGGSRTGGRILIFGGARGSSPAAKLHALWQVLLPAEARTQWKDCREAIVVPDGSLHLLPFEALIIERTPQRTVYWLDEGPVVRYAPSFTALRALEKSLPPTPPVDPARAEMLSLSDPVFDVAEVARRAADPNLAPNEAAAAEERTAAARSASFFLDGPLDDLHGTAWEREAILEALGKERVTVLRELDATEAALRQALPGRRYLHLATHGLVDEKRSNLFAALVLTPSQSETPPPADDGLLQLHEIYDLDLSGCEVAVLSACRTNVGRGVRGEGVFALSRGLLVAGAHRVVASQWSVNDASTAELIAAFFRQVKAQEKTGTLDYALALRNARREIRATRRWVGPRYWAPFVLIGAR